MPVFNEATTVGEILKRVLAQPCVQEVIAINDGSTDGTAVALREWPGRDSRVQVVSHPVNRGKGAAVRTGLARIQSPLVIVQDADLEYNPRDFGRIIEPLLQGETLVVYGSRYLKKSVRGAPRLFRWGVGGLNLCVWLLYGTRLTDEATCYKATFTGLLRSMDLQCDRFEFCPELTAKACRLGLNIREVPVCYDSRNKAEGKKIRWVDGLAAVRTLWKWRHWPGELSAGQAAREFIAQSTVRSSRAGESRATGNVIRAP